MTQAEKARVQAEIDRLPIGSRVRVRDCPGLGVGVVREHITERVMGSTRNRVTVPLVGHCKMYVEFEGGSPGGEFDSTELSLLQGKNGRPGTYHFP
jgi:hypothetical protein